MIYRMTYKIAPHPSHGLPDLRDVTTILALNCDVLLGTPETVPNVGLTHSLYAELDADLLARTAPDLVIIPLFTADHDANAMIERLVALGYGGKVAVLAPPLPNPPLVERELGGLGLQVTLVCP